VPLFLNKTFSWFATGLSLLSLSPFLQNECMTSMARKGEKSPRLPPLRHHQPARASESERRALLTAVVADVPFQIRIRIFIPQPHQSRHYFLLKNPFCEPCICGYAVFLYRAKVLIVALHEKKFLEQRRFIRS
jgi:hypothetical protein